MEHVIFTDGIKMERVNIDLPETKKKKIELINASNSWLCLHLKLSVESLCNDLWRKSFLFHLRLSLHFYLVYLISQLIHARNMTTNWYVCLYNAAVEHREIEQQMRMVFNANTGSPEFSMFGQAFSLSGGIHNKNMKRNISFFKGKNRGTITSLQLIKGDRRSTRKLVQNHFSLPEYWRWSAHTREQNRESEWVKPWRKEL